MMIALTIIIIFGTSGCWSRYYKGDYPELFTVALNSLLGITGVAPNMIDDPGITMLEEDNYGRTLFMYREGRGLGISILISQKSDEHYVYFYPHYNFIIFETFAEMTARTERMEGLRLDQFYPEAIEQVDELKERNDWNQELNLEKSTRKEIDVFNNFNREGPVRDSILLELYNIALGDDAFEHPLKYYVNLLTTDDYGRSVYWGTGGEWNNRRYVVMFFQPDGSFDEVKGFMEWEDRLHYQTALREFKERGGWNQPFEGPTEIPLWWKIVGLVVIVGAGGLIGAKLYLRRRGEMDSLMWLPIKREENLGQLLIALGSNGIYTLKGGLRDLSSFYSLGRGKRRIFSLLYLITPSILVNGLFLFPIALNLGFLWIPSRYSVLLLYLVTMVGIILYFKFKPCKFNMLISGLILPSLTLFMYAMVALITSFAPSGIIIILYVLIAIMPTLFYSLPFVAISFYIKRLMNEKDKEPGN